MKWDSSTRIPVNRRDTSVNSAINQQLNTSQTRHSLKQGERSVNRSTMNLTGNASNTGRAGAHSTVGQSERWGAISKRPAGLNISQQEISQNEFANQKNA